MIKLIGPNQYSNFKSDMMSRNKIDAVNFELNNVKIKKSEVLSLDIKIQKIEKINTVDTLKLEKGIWQKEELKNKCSEWLIWENEAELNQKFLALEYNEIDQYFNNKYLGIIDGSTLSLALIVEPSDSLVFDSLISIYASKSNTELDLKYSNQEANYSGELLYKEKIIETLLGTGLTVENPTIKYFNEKQLVVYLKFNITKLVTDYTETINLSIVADTWSADKTTHQYKLGGFGGNSAVAVSQNPDGTFEGTPPKYPFEYHSSEILQYETKQFGGLMHQSIAQELLKVYKNGCRIAEFDLPEAEIFYCDQYGDLIYDDNDKTILHAPSKTSELKVGDEIIIQEKYKGEMRFVGGIYRDIQMWDKDGNGIVEVNIPRRFKITNMEYKYNGAPAYAVKALEMSFNEINDKARNNGQLSIYIDNRGIPLN